MRLHGPDEPVYTIGVAARLLGVSPQTLRAIEREGLLEPYRTEANIRLYSENDLLLLRRIRNLISEEGVNLAGVKIILEMEARMGKMTIKYREVSLAADENSRDPEDDKNRTRP